jgi:uncharacterized protein YkwD
MTVGFVSLGAQRASVWSRIAAITGAAVVATLFSFAAASATPSGVSAATPPSYDTELYYLKLVNCTRTGGWVLSDGTCKGYGSGRYSKYVAPLRLSACVSSVARGWAKYLVVNARCVHGDPGARLRKAGFTSYRWAENIGCRDGYTSAKRAVLATHRFYQSEKPTNGGHWRNIKNPAYKSIGIGVWRVGTRTRLVTDFYTP